MPRFVTCGPNEAIIVSGCCHTHPVMRVGGRVFVWPIFHKIQRISLNTMTLNVESSKVYSDGGVPVTVKGVAQVKVQGNDLEALRYAAEMFLDKTEDEIMEIAKATLEGHQRSKIASMRIEAIYEHRKEFSNDVQQSAQIDLTDMGLTLVSYTVHDISDDVGYLDALGQKNIVAVCSEARIDIAKTKSTSECRSMETEQEKREKEIEYEQEIALQQLDFEIYKAKHLKETHENQAKSEKAGDLQLAEMNKKIADEELKVVVLEKKKETELILKKKELKQLELNNAVERKAYYQCEREKELAKAHEEKTKIEARTEAIKIRKLAEARAEVIKQQKEAEAEVLHERAQAFMQFGNAAKLEMVLAILPRMTAEIAGPISECKKITSVSQDGSVGFSRITNEILEVVEQLCDSVGNITGQSLMRGNINDDSSPPSPPNARGGPAGPSSVRESPTEGKPSSSLVADRTRTFSSFSRTGGYPRT